MSFKTITLIKCVVCLGFGPALLFFPDQVLGVLGAPFGVGAAIMSREYGAALIGNVFLTWFSRNATYSEARRAIIIYLFVYDAVALVAMTVLQLRGMMNGLGWSIVAIYVFFTLAYGYLLLSGERRTVAAM